MWTDKDKQEIITKYQKQFKKYGYHPCSLFWPKGRQKLRFKILSEIGIGSNDSVIDIGCGFGDLLAYLQEHYTGIKYTGIDIVPEFISQAKEQYPDGDFRITDILRDTIEKKWDYVFASGVFNIRLPSGSSEEFIKSMIQKMFDLCVKGIACDFMSTYVDYQQEDAFHCNPTMLFDYAKSLSRRVVLRNDYMPFEFTVYIYKNDSFERDNVFNAYRSFL